MLGLVYSFEQCTGQKNALTAIYNGLNGDAWANGALWATETPICSWEGITCNRDGFVIGLNISDQGATGILTDQIECLPFLKSFYMNNNTLGSALPIQICNIPTLQYFQADNASLIGEIPICLCNLVNAQYIYLSYNLLTGVIPTCIGQLAHLKELHLTCNDITGVIPAGFETLQYLTELRINCNAQLDCTSGLSTLTNFIFLCGNVFCDNCTISPVSCPHSITVPGCGLYFSPIH